MSSLKPIGNIVVICCAFFIIFGILGVQVCGSGGKGGSCQPKPEERLSSGSLDGQAQAGAPFIPESSKQGDIPPLGLGLGPLCRLGTLQKTGSLDEGPAGGRGLREASDL